MTEVGALPGSARLPVLAAALTLGVMLGVAGALPGRGPCVAVGAAALLVVMLGRRARGGWARLGLTAAWLVALAAAGGALGARARPPGLAGAELHRPLLLEVEVLAPAAREAAGLRLEVALARAGEEVATLAPARGRVVLRVATVQAGERLLPGDRLRLRATLRPLQRFSNPGVPDPVAAILRARGVAASAWLPSLAGVVRTGPAARARGATRLAGRVRAALAAQLLGEAGGGGGGAGGAGGGEDDVARALLAALVIGERATLPDEVEAAFRRAGVTHVLSVSGLHLAAVALVLLGLTTALAARTRLAARVPAPRLAALATAPLLVLYALATGAAPATMRALAMALLALTAVALGRGAHVPTVIAAALAGWAVCAPGALADPSLQLSFAAVIALACTARPIRRLLERRWPLEPPAPTRARRLGRRATRAVVQLVLASAAATLAGLPISALHFGTFAPAGVVTNVVVVPLAELVIIPLGLAGAALGALLPVLGQLPVAGALALTRALLALVHAAAAPAPELAVAAPTLLLLVVFYAALGLALAARGRPRLLAVAAALLVVAHLGWPRGARAWSPPRGLRASFLDVGQGDATLLELPGARILIDAGGSLDGRGLDPGERAVLPALRARHVDHLELVVISHPHPDHIGGLLAVARAIPIDTLWWSGDASGDPRLAPLLAELAARGTFITRPPLHSQLGGAELDALHPQATRDTGDDAAAHIEADDGLTTNDNSLVIRMRYAGRALLFPGDLEAEGEDLARAYAGAALRADVLKLPHHGSRTSSTDDFLDAVGPSIAVLSCGAGNRFGFPHAEVSARLEARAIHVLRTDRMGGITITIAPDGALRTATTRGGQW